MGTQQFSLRWNNYLRHITSAFDSLRTDKDLVDVTLSCEGKKIKAHKMLLSACSSYFKDLFKDNPCQHPVVIFRNVKFEDLDALVNFMYQGEVNVLQEQLASFLTTAELLEVQGLTDGGTNPEEEEELETEIVPPPPVPQREFRPEKRRSQPQSSNETMSPVSFIPINKRPESPLTKRRKFLSSSSSMKPSEKDTESRRHAQQQQQQQQQLSSPDPVEVIPVVPNVKIEKPEYYESDQGGGEYSDSMHASNSNQEMTDMSEHGHLDSKQEAVDIYEDSGDSSHLEGLSDLSSILSKPGTSVESVSQESLHGHFTKTSSHVWTFVSSKVCEEFPLPEGITNYQQEFPERITFRKRGRPRKILPAPAPLTAPILPKDIKPKSRKPYYKVKRNRPRGRPRKKLHPVTLKLQLSQQPPQPMQQPPQLVPQPPQLVRRKRGRPRKDAPKLIPDDGLSIIADCASHTEIEIPPSFFLDPDRILDEGSTFISCS